MGRSTFSSLNAPRMMAYSRGKPIELANRWHAPDITAWVLDVHQAIAQKALTEYGCLRWRVDGGIFPLGMGKRFVGWLSGLGIAARITHSGRGQLFSIDTLRVGDHATARYRHGNRAEDFRCDNIGAYRVKYDDFNWLLKLLENDSFMRMEYRYNAN